MSVQETPPATGGADSPPSVGATRLRAVIGSQITVLALVAIVLYVYFASQNSRFFTVGETGNLLTDFSSLILLAIAETYIIVSGGIDLSVSGTVAVSNSVTAYVLAPHVSTMSLPHILIEGTVVAVLTGLVVGALNAFMITVINLVPFVATLITLYAAGGVALVITQGGTIGFNAYSGVWSTHGFGPFSYLTLMVLSVMAIFAVWLHFTKYGRAIFAIGSNPFAARAAGINVKRHVASIYIWSGVLSGLVGMFFYIRTGSGNPQTGQNMNLEAIACVVIGGVALIGGSGNALGVILGCAITTIITDGLIFINVQPTWQPVVVAALIFVAVTLQAVKGRFRIPGLRRAVPEAGAK